MLLLLLLRIGIGMDIAVVVITVLPHELHGVRHRHLVNLWERYRAIRGINLHNNQMINYLLDVLPYVVLAHGAVIAEGAEERLHRRVHLDVFVVGHGYAEHL